MYQVVKVGLVPNGKSVGVKVTYAEPQLLFSHIIVDDIFLNNIELANHLGKDSWRLIQILPSDDRARGLPEEMWFTKEI